MGEDDREGCAENRDGQTRWPVSEDAYEPHGPQGSSVGAEQEGLFGRGGVFLLLLLS